LLQPVLAIPKKVIEDLQQPAAIHHYRDIVPNGYLGIDLVTGVLFFAELQQFCKES